jgi:hypothetical protein
MQSGHMQRHASFFPPPSSVSSTLGFHGYSKPGFGFAEPRRTGIATSTMKNRSMPLINQRRHSGTKAASLDHGNRLDAAASPRYDALGRDSPGVMRKETRRSGVILQQTERQQRAAASR